LAGLPTAVIMSYPIENRYKVLDAAKEIFNNHRVEVRDALEKLE
jgi:predicted RNA binding protein with dsRBD fold (UPF0201 family)